jgi:hypothetical protein
LREGGYALGVVARKGKGGVLLGYFFGPRKNDVPSLKDARSLSSKDAILVEQFGHLSLRDRTWPIIGTLEHWDREAWPIPAFCRTESLTGRTWKVVYDDSLARPVSEERCSPEVASTLLPNQLAGAGAVEIQLTELLRGSGTT